MTSTLEKERIAVKKYRIIVRETLEKVLDIEASSREEAEEQAKHAWKIGDCVLSADDFTEVTFTASED